MSIITRFQPKVLKYLPARVNNKSLSCVLLNNVFQIYVFQIMLLNNVFQWYEPAVIYKDINNTQTSAFSFGLTTLLAQSFVGDL